MRNWSPNRVFFSIVALEALLIPATRLAQWRSPTQFVDGDEAVLGLVALRALDGHGLSVLFPGQAYGFSLVEGGLVAAAFVLFGPSALALKAAMLALWSGGWLAMILAVRRFSGARAAALAGLLLIFCPAWTVWSMKARGGYLTAFALANLTLWMLAARTPKGRSGRLRAAAAGVCAGLVAFSQPTFLLPLAPFVALRKWGRGRGGELMALAAGAAVTIIAIFVISVGAERGVWAPSLFEGWNPGQSLVRLPERLWTHFGGFYFLGARPPLGVFTRAAATLWTLSFVIWFVAACARARRSGGISIDHAYPAAAIVVPIVAVALGANGFGYRYLLAASGFFILGLAPVLAERSRQSGVAGAAAWGAAALLCLSGALSQLEIETNRFAPAEAPEGYAEAGSTAELIGALEAQGVEHVYSFEPMVQWVIVFASRERIAARWLRPEDRLARYGPRVDAALQAGRPIALVCMSYDEEAMRYRLRSAGLGDLRTELVAGRYFIVYDPPMEFLRALDFQFRAP